MKSGVTGPAHKDGTLPCVLPAPQRHSRHRRWAEAAGAPGTSVLCRRGLGKKGRGENSWEAAHLGRATQHPTDELIEADSSRLRVCQSASLAHYMHKEHSGE